MANPLWVDTFTQADLDLIVFKREVERKQFPLIGREMNRHWKTCFHRYTRIVKQRIEPAIVPKVRTRRPTLSQELGIETYVHLQAVLHSPGGRYSRGIRGEQVNAHWYRMPITLAKVWA